MKTRSIWKSPNRLDSIMNVLLIVLALGVLGLGAWEVESNPVHIAASNQQQA